MKKIVQLINSLKPHEVKLIKNYYRKNKRRKNEIRLRLFSNILKGKLSNITTSDSSFSHLKSRVEKDIINLISSQDIDKIYAMDFAKSAFRVKQEIIQSELLFNRGAYLKAVKMVEELRVISLNYELFEERVKINDMLRSHLAANLKDKRIEVLSSEIERDLKNLSWLMESKSNYLKALTANSFSSKEEESNFIAKYSKEIGRVFKINRSHRIGMLYYVCRIRQFSTKHSFNMALSEALKFKDLIEESCILNTGGNNLRILTEISKIQFNLKLYPESYKNALKAREYGYVGVLAELRLIELLFLISFQARRIRVAKKHLEEGSKHNIILGEKGFLQAKWSFYDAALLFLNKKYSNSKELLDKLVKRDFKKDEYKWFIGFLVLKIIIEFELENKEGAINRLRYFRLHMLKYKIKDRRIKTIYKIFKSLGENSCYDITYKKHKKLFVKLKTGKDEFYWNPLGYEIIRFDEWFVNKVSPRKR